MGCWFWRVLDHTQSYRIRGSATKEGVRIMWYWENYQWENTSEWLLYRSSSLDIYDSFAKDIITFMVAGLLIVAIMEMINWTRGRNLN